MKDKRNAALIYEDSKAEEQLRALETALGLYPRLVTDPYSGIPGIPSFPNGNGHGPTRYQSVWSEDRREYLSDTPFGLARKLWGGDVGYALSRYAPFYHIVTPKEGVELPEAQLPRIGDVFLDGVTGMATVTVEGDAGPVPAHNVRLGLEHLKRGYEVLKQVRKSLLQANVPVLPARVWRHDSLAYPFEEGETEFSTVNASNGETVVPVVGYAMDKRVREVIYLHLAGWKTSCRSIWASLNSSSGKLVHVHGSDGSDAAFGTHNYHTYSDAIDADMGIYRLMAVDRRVVATEVDERAYLLIHRGEDEADVDRLFAGRLNAVLPIPIRPEWGRVLRREGVKAELVRAIKAGGDVAHAYALEPNEAWYNLVEELLRSGALTI